jgi:ABC-2 type transport system permease protein
MASLLLALFLASAIQTVMDMSLLWTISGKGLSGLMAAMIMMFSGMIIPLPLFPEWMQPFISFLPFRGLHDLPARLYMGHVTPQDGIGPILHQLTWTIFLSLLGRALLARGVRRVIVQGG